MSTEQNMGINDDKAQQSPSASSPKVAPTVGGVTAPGVSHTPGPWFATQEMANRWRITSFVSDDLVPDSIAIVTHTVLGVGGHAQQTEANARLIAAAPELLEALKRLVAIIHPEIAGSDGSPLEFAKAVLAKVAP